MATVTTPKKPSEIKQSELAEFLVLKSSSKSFTEARESIVDRFLKGASTEKGALDLNVTSDVGTAIKYKEALKQLVEKHPTLKKEAEGLVRQFTSHPDKHEVQITPATSV